jgi:thioesterase domain-containing protein
MPIRNPGLAAPQVNGTQRDFAKFQRQTPVRFSTSADENRASHSGYSIDPDHRAELQRMATALRRAESWWTIGERPVQGSIVAFHDPVYVDETLVPCFMLPSLPQRSTDFMELASMMDPSQPFFALYLPSEKRHAETASTVARLAQYYASEIHNIWPTGPIAVGGWAGGATVALAVTSLLRALGHAVPLLVAVDGAPPSVNIEPPDLFEKTRLTYFRLSNAITTLAELGGDLWHRVRHRPPQHPLFRHAVRSAWAASAFRPIWQRTTEPITGRAAAWLLGKPLQQRHPVETSTDISDLPPAHRDFVAAVYDAVGAYGPDANYRGEVLVFESTAEPARSSAGIAKRWAKIATEVKLVAVEGSHISIVAGPDGRPLARTLCEKLQEVSLRQAMQIQYYAKTQEGSAQPAITMTATHSRVPAYLGGASSPAG